MATSKTINYTERMVGANHPTLTDTLNRLTLVSHDQYGNHMGYVDASSYATFADCLADVPVTKTIQISTIVSVDGGTTISHPLHFVSGGTFYVASGTVTLNGPVTADLSQHFTGTGSVVFGSGSVTEVYPEWWATNTTPGTTDMTSAIQSAVDSAVISSTETIPVSLSSTIYKTTDTIELHPYSIVTGDGRGSSIVGYGNNVPIFARLNYTDRNIGGQNYITIKDLKIIDYSTGRSTYYTIDLSNCHSCTIKNVDISTGIDGTPIADFYGVFLGKSLSSTYSGNTFLGRVEFCRLSRSKIYMNGTDWYICQNEVWGNERDVAITCATGGALEGNQIVGGETYGGLYLENENGYDIEIMRISGNYFDGSYASIDTKRGITGYATAGLKNSTITGNVFWRCDEEAIYLPKAYRVTITGNAFQNCDSRDLDKSDIYLKTAINCTVSSNTFTRDSYKKPSGSKTLGAKGSAIVFDNTGYSNNVVGNNVDTPYYKSPYFSLPSSQTLGYNTVVEANIPSYEGTSSTISQVTSTLDLSAAEVELVIVAALTQNITTVTFPSRPYSGQRLCLRLSQSASQSYTISFASDTRIKLAGNAFTLTAAPPAQKIDILEFIYDAVGNRWMEISRSQNLPI